MVKRGEPPPLAILFADTGGERPYTYQHINSFSWWLQERGYPPITTVRVEKETLEEMCLRLGVLPSVAYGWKTCSARFKVEPQEKWLRNSPQVRAEWEAGRTITKVIGFEYGEERRVRPSKDPRMVNRYPLIEWRMDREACLQSIRSEGIELPGKSACFFCPNSKKAEILALRVANPDLYNRAIAMEANATKNTQVKGLGRSWAWSWLTEQSKVIDPSAENCDCFDGDT
jgi:hypothetical protein